MLEVGAVQTIRSNALLRLGVGYEIGDRKAHLALLDLTREMQLRLDSNPPLR